MKALKSPGLKKDRSKIVYPWDGSQSSRNFLQPELCIDYMESIIYWKYFHPSLPQ